ncbi:MAG TPA: hypothetical protein PK922_03760 [Syntrophorhabdus sp.]|nr:hypothetical protein [Syntrophorhabdus sp.]
MHTYVDANRGRRIPVGHDGYRLTLICRPDRLLHGNNAVHCLPGIDKMICGDLQIF